METDFRYCENPVLQIIMKRSSKANVFLMICRLKFSQMYMIKSKNGGKKRYK